MQKRERARLQREFSRNPPPPGLCPLCFKRTERWHADHIVPVTMGGSWEESNRQWICNKCHGRKTYREKVDPFSILPE
jgi:5-methylcytosine-specific restriction endonuclease McrA